MKCEGGRREWKGRNGRHGRKKGTEEGEKDGIEGREEGRASQGGNGFTCDVRIVVQPQRTPWC
jgi:hypothetical protein